jgi:hypothetical protein
MAAPKKRRTRSRILTKVDENVTAALKDLDISLKGPGVARALHAGATMIAEAARPDAPTASGQLKAGVFTASILHNEYRPLVRARTGRRLNSPLKFPPRPRQALVWSSVFYTRFIEKGRKPRSVYDVEKKGVRGVRRNTGRIRKRPFFQRAKRRMRKPATEEITRRLQQLIEEAWQRK